MLLLLVILAGVPSPPFSFALVVAEALGGVAGETPILIASAYDSDSVSTPAGLKGAAAKEATPVAFFLGVEDLAGVEGVTDLGAVVVEEAEEERLASRSA